MMIQFMNDSNDIEWLKSTHLRNCSGFELDELKSFVIYGNEDAPDQLHLYAEHDPKVTDVYYLVNFNLGISEWITPLGV